MSANRLRHLGILVALGGWLWTGAAWGNSIQVTSTAAMGGSAGQATCSGDGQPGPCGLEVVVNNQQNVGVISRHADKETHVKVGFWLDPATLDMKPLDKIRVLRGISSTSPGTANGLEHLVVFLKRAAGDANWRMTAWQQQNFGFFAFIGEFFFTAGGGPARFVEVEWKQGTGVQGAQDGTVRIFLDGVLQAERTDLNTSGFNFNEFRTGAFGIAKDTTEQPVGSFYLDEFTLSRLN